jgi:transposase
VLVLLQLDKQASVWKGTKLWHKQQQPTFFSQQFENLMPAGDKFRIIKENIDFTFINDLARPHYGDIGPTGYSPDKLFRMLIVMYMENIASERKLEERLKFDIRYRYFCDLDIMDEIPDHATFSVFRSRLGDELFKEIFERLLDMIFALGFEKPRHISIDSTSVIADCARPRAKKDKDDNRGGGSGTGSRPPADPDARWGIKGKKPSHFGYKAHYIVDSEKGLILGTETTSASAADVTVAKEIVPKTLDRHRLDPAHLAADKAYNSPALRDELKAREIEAVIPLKQSGRTPSPGFGKADFEFSGDILFCPAQKAMTRYNIKDGTTLFAGTGCSNCSERALCTESKRKVRRVKFRPGWQKRLKDAAFEKTDEFKELYKQRSSVERVNSEAKRQHGLTRARYRRLEKVAVQGYLTAIVINLKRTVGFLAAKAPPKTALAGLA